MSERAANGVMRGDLVFERVGLEAGGRAVLSDVDLRIGPGDFLALIGPNGAGKTTLLRTALGLVRPTQRPRALGSIDVASMPPVERAARIAWLPQVAPPPEGLSARETVAAARYRFREGHASSLVAADAALARVSASAARRASLSRCSRAANGSAS